MIDGHKQREALTAAERSLHLLDRGALGEAIGAAERARELDQVDTFARLPTAVARVAGHLEHREQVPAEAWEALAEAVGPGPLRSHVADLQH